MIYFNIALASFARLIQCYGKVLLRIRLSWCSTWVRNLSRVAIKVAVKHITTLRVVICIVLNT